MKPGSRKQSSLSKSFGWRFNGRIGVLAIFASILCGCNDGDQPMSQRVSVSGQVTLDGQPLKAGAIVFRIEGQASNDSSTAFGFVEDGSYCIDADNGPAVGLANVEFRPKPLQREALEQALDQAFQSRTRRPTKTTIVDIPAKYGEGSQLRTQLSRGENRCDFHLESRP